MCEYSLEGWITKPAKTGESYKLTNMAHTGHKVFVDACHGIVCMPEGARLRLEGIRKRDQARLFIDSNAVDATMIRIPVGLGKFRDGVRFESGAMVMLQHLPSGIVARVLLPVAKDAPEDTDLASPKPAVSKKTRTFRAKLREKLGV